MEHSGQGGCGTRPFCTYSGARRVTQRHMGSTNTRKARSHNGVSASVHDHDSVVAETSENMKHTMTGNIIAEPNSAKHMTRDRVDSSSCPKQHIGRAVMLAVTHKRPH